MGSLSDHSENSWLDHVLKTSSWTQPTIYVALSTTAPSDDGTNVSEPSGNNYSREAVSAWDAASSRSTANTNKVTFNQASGTWGTISHFAIYDASSGGNMIAHGSLSSSRTVNANQTPEFSAGEFDISVNAGEASNHMANGMLDHIFENTSFTVPTNIYVALTTATISDSDGGGDLSEPASGYSRQNQNSWDAASGGTSSNSGLISFSVSADWASTVATALVDSSSGAGNVLFYDNSDLADFDPASGDTVEFPAGNWTAKVS